VTGNPLDSLTNLIIPPDDPELTSRIVAMIRGLDRECADPLAQLDANLRDMVGHGVPAARVQWGAEDAGLSRRERAQELVYMAWDTDDPDERRALAHAALELDQNLPGAYVVLAECESDLPHRIDLYHYALRLCEVELGAENMTLWVGAFWGIPETRPYMRTRCGLAQTLWEAGEYQEAVAHYVELLRLDPNDHLGVRYWLVHAYLFLQENDALSELFAAYPDEIVPEWLYSKALLAWRVGHVAQANEMLTLALGVNAFVPDYLLLKRRLPKVMPIHLTFGGKDEAMSYEEMFGDLWRQTPGAVEWLEARVES